MVDVIHATNLKAAKSRELSRSNTTNLVDAAGRFLGKSYDPAALHKFVTESQVNATPRPHEGEIEGIEVDEGKYNELIMMFCILPRNPRSLIANGQELKKFVDI